MDDNAFEENLPEELRGIADALSAGRDVPDGHQLDRVQRRVAAGRARRGTLLSQRLPGFGAVGLLLAAVLAVALAHGSIGQVVSSLANAVTSGTPAPAATTVYCQPSSSTTAIQSNFNSTPIAAGNVIWFSAVFKISGLSASGSDTLTFTNQTISNIPGVSGSVSAPNSQITISPGATPSATYNQATNTWMITLPTGFSGNGLLAAVPVVDTNGAPKGGNGTGPTWSGTLSSSSSAVSINWQWAAAVYPASSGFPTTPAGYNAIGVSPLDGFVGSDHAGTPENFKTHVIGGATGGGGSNYTGSLSSTQTLSCVGSGTPGATPLTPGAWFSSPNYKPLTTSLLSKHPQHLGGYVVSTYSQAQAIFAAMNCGASTNEGAVGCLAGHLLAAELNVVNGAPEPSCASTAISQANSFLTSVGYAGPTGNYTLSASQRSTAISLNNTLDGYDNGNGNTC